MTDVAAVKPKPTESKAGGKAEWHVVNGNEQLSDAAIKALAALLIEIAEPEAAEEDTNEPT